ncbi:heme-binding protein [Sandaracinobacteroides hominis]|uniref:heme-binding protein n=1 Tax=Sandaracinobacteroides hominis TaxID=2780086 RepID=UPI0018F6BE64|nr:heme-binding protein [Sandaracinobacteroides hominis]
MVMSAALVAEMAAEGRKIFVAQPDDPKLGPLQWLPGNWVNTEELKGQGFNMMALPFGDAGENGYRLLMNQYDETLSFIIADEGVPNRGVDANGAVADQIAVALSYIQKITQISSEDAYVVSARGKTETIFGNSKISEKFDGKGIHHEPGLWMYMTNLTIQDEFSGQEIDIARMGSIPHGNSFIAVGSAEQLEPNSSGLVPRINGVVIGGGHDPDERALDPILVAGTNTIRIDYFGPFRYFHQNPFKGTVAIQGFDGMDPVDPTRLLAVTLESTLKRIGTIKNVIRLSVDSTKDHAGIHRVGNPSIGNTPFITRQADTTAMNSTFTLYEIEDAASGQPRYFMQYAQNVILDFINRPDGHPGRARWPHVSINTLERVSVAKPEALFDGLPAR